MPWKRWHALIKSKMLEEWASRLLSSSTLLCSLSKPGGFCRILKLYGPGNLEVRFSQIVASWEDRKGARRSWGWNSIFEGRDGLRKGACWQIGYGESIKVFADPRVAGAENFKILPKDRENIDEE